ncbi:MAG: hypothetical protein NWE96_04780 [Candidatus Bathyarchaeota archaeon]|nr:hypothetical protein [Candidatus Bathyarchaeota archaeon]
MKQTTKPRDINPKTLLGNLLLTAFIFGTIGIALKFTTYFNHWIYFSAFPNALDSTFLILSVTYYAAYIIHKNKQNQTKTKKPK